MPVTPVKIQRSDAVLERKLLSRLHFAIGDLVLIFNSKWVSIQKLLIDLEVMPASGLK